MPLSSLRILDLSRLLPGPYCSMFFSDFGAEVIKIEEPNLGDYVRWNDTKVGENSAVFHSLNRNKKSVTLNLKTEKGKEVFRKLVETSDIVLESFRPGVMDRLGIGYEDLKKINPGIIYCAITGYGQDGPYAQMPGHDINYQSYAGLLGLQGHVEGPPVISAIQIADIGGGSQMATIGILIALQARNQTGEGQFVDIAMRDGVMSWMQSMYPDYFVNNKVLEKGKLRLGGGKACYYAYETADERYLSVGALEEKFWKVFCTEIEAPHLIEKLNAPFEEQMQMKAEIAAIIKKKSLEEWNVIFEGKDACVSPILNIDEVVHDPQVKARNMVIEKDDEKYLGFPIKLSKTPGEIRHSAPNLGENNQDIFTKLGYSSEEIEAWKKDGIL